MVALLVAGVTTFAHGPQSGSPFMGPFAVGEIRLRHFEGSIHSLEDLQEVVRSEEFRTRLFDSQSDNPEILRSFYGGGVKSIQRLDPSLPDVSVLPLVIERTWDLRVLGIFHIFLKSDPRIFEVGYYLNPRYRGQGYGRKAVAAAVLGLRRQEPGVGIVARTREDNWPSRRVLEANGFSQSEPRPGFVPKDWCAYLLGISHPLEAMFQ